MDGYAAEQEQQHDQNGSSILIPESQKIDHDHRRRDSSTQKHALIEVFLNFIQSLISSTLFVFSKQNLCPFLVTCIPRITTAPRACVGTLKHLPAITRILNT